MPQLLSTKQIKALEGVDLVAALEPYSKLTDMSPDVSLTFVDELTEDRLEEYNEVYEGRDFECIVIGSDLLPGSCRRYKTGPKFIEGDTVAGYYKSVRVDKTVFESKVTVAHMDCYLLDSVVQGLSMGSANVTSVPNAGTLPPKKREALKHLLSGNAKGWGEDPKLQPLEKSRKARPTVKPTAIPDTTYSEAIAIALGDKLQARRDMDMDEDQGEARDEYTTIDVPGLIRSIGAGKAPTPSSVVLGVFEDESSASDPSANTVTGPCRTKSNNPTAAADPDVAPTLKKTPLPPSPPARIAGRTAAVTAKKKITDTAALTSGWDADAAGLAQTRNLSDISDQDDAPRTNKAPRLAAPPSVDDDMDSYSDRDDEEDYDGLPSRGVPRVKLGGLAKKSH